MNTKDVIIQQFLYKIFIIHFFCFKQNLYLYYSLVFCMVMLEYNNLAIFLLISVELNQIHCIVLYIQMILYYSINNYLFYQLLLFYMLYNLIMAIWFMLDHLHSLLSLLVHHLLTCNLILLNSLIIFVYFSNYWYLIPVVYNRFIYQK
jgi:hypothetical protein